ncbi:MAG: diguanylate cyclase [Bacillota bacterium]
MEAGLLILAVATIVLTFMTCQNKAQNNFYQHLFGLEEVFSGELDFIHLSKNILTKVMQEVPSIAGVIYWFDEVRAEFKLKALNGIPIDQINQVTRELRKPGGVLERVVAEPAGFILETRKSLLTNKIIADSKSFILNYSSVMTVPLLIQKETRGAIVLFRQKGAYSRKKLDLLMTFAPRAAAQLESARLYQLAKETAQENAKLYINLSELYQKATLDELTGLYNRNFLMQRIREEIKKSWRFKQPLSLIFMDLDFFKRVNDEYGHQMGDQLLTELGDFVKKSIRDYDVACRFGGEEFVILLPQTKLVNAYDLADRLREKIAAYDFCASAAGSLKVTASFGVSIVPDFSEQQTQLSEEQINIIVENAIAWADDALYQAKKAGRNRVISHPKQQIS